MTENDIKLLCKLAVEKSDKPLNSIEKEVLKQAIDEAKTVDELFAIAISKFLI